MSTRNEPNHAHRVTEAGRHLAPKHFRWLAWAALDAMERDTDKLERRLATIYTLREHGTGVRTSPADVRALEESLADHRQIIAFAKALDEAVAELAVTASVCGWKAAGAALAKWVADR